MSDILDKYELVCGLEIHAELKTASKMFCGCKNDPFHAEEPNIHTCPVCLGMPGGLPVANKKAIEWTIKLGLSLNCKINLFSKFDRKNYFYPDLPKGYQISQYDIPFCYDGYVDTTEGRVGITRIHLEEDTGKLQHTKVDGKNVSLVDFNRSGVPLVEIVTEPDIVSPNQAKEYAKHIRRQLRYLDIADCDMDQGGMRLEANISLKRKGASKLPDYKVEVKNINSFRFMEQAVEFEMERHAHMLEKGQMPTQETRGWNPHKNESFSQRTKEDAEDYRYFPDPDLPPLQFTKADISKLESELPEDIDSVIKRWSSDYAISIDPNIEIEKDVQILDLLFKEAKAKKIPPNKIYLAIINKDVSLDTHAVKAYIEQTKTDDVDPGALRKQIKAAIEPHREELDRYRSGEKKLFNFFIGQVMRSLKSKPDMQLVRTTLTELLES